MSLSVIIKKLGDINMSEESKLKNKQDDVVEKKTSSDEGPVIEKQQDVEKLPSFRGLDVGTNLLVSSKMSEVDDGVSFKMQRDCFYRIVPKSEVNKNSIKMSLDKRQANYFIDEDGSFIVVGNDALEIAIERHDVAERPLQKGVISPQNKKSLPILKRMIKDLVGATDVQGSKVVYSVPASPIDNDFDIVYHTEIVGMYLKELGYDSSPINEPFAIALSELLDDGLTGISISMGAGMTNTCVMHQGDPLIEFSLTRSGDFIDQSVGKALDMSPSLIQQEKEAGVDLINPKTEIENAISVYYNAVIKYTLENIAYELNSRKKELPILRESVPLVMAGGLTLAKGFTEKVEQVLATVDFPIKISKVRLASDPMTAVSHGCLLAAHL
jgi:hypothetical protein